jgi:hypothetical protein
MRLDAEIYAQIISEHTLVPECASFRITLEERCCREPQGLTAVKLVLYY